MRRGGKREGAGRPVGARDKFPRSPKRQAHNIKAQISEYWDKSEFLITNEDKLHQGNAFQFIKDVRRAEQLPVNIRLHAACKEFEYELRYADAGFRVDADTGEAYEQKLLDQIQSLREGILRDRDAELSKLVEQGVISAENAPLFRRVYAEEGDPDWQYQPPPPILPLPPPAPTPPEPEPPAPTIESLPPLWKSVPMDRVTRLVFGEPGITFKVGDRRYQANELGEIAVSDVLDEQALLRVGCRAER